MCSIHTMKYYSALEREDILTRASTWMSFKDIILRTNTLRFHLYEVPAIVKSIETESGCQAPGQRQVGT